jgi:excisionase family DNA binding protein
LRRRCLTNFYSPSSLASWLSLDRKTVYRAIDRGELRAFKIGAALRIDPEDVQDWLERSAV